MDKRGPGGPRHSRPGGRRYIHLIAKLRSHGTSAGLRPIAIDFEVATAENPPHLLQALRRNAGPRVEQPFTQVYRSGFLEVCNGRLRGGLSNSRAHRTRYENFGGADKATAASLVRTRKTNVSWRYSRTRVSVWLR